LFTRAVIAFFKSPPKSQAKSLSADKQGFTQIIEKEDVLIFQSLFYPCLSVDIILGFFGFLLEISIYARERKNVRAHVRCCIIDRIAR
jgi:hypothetical protein